jgi:hypothetical protein
MRSLVCCAAWVLLLVGCIGCIGCIGDSSAAPRVAEEADAKMAVASSAATAASPKACVAGMSLMCCEDVHPVRLSGRPRVLDGTGLGASCVPAGASASCEAPVCCVSDSSALDGHQCELR